MITCPLTAVVDENGMEVEQHYLQFIVSTTFKVKMVDQLKKEKKKAVVTQNYNITDDVNSKDNL